MHHKQPAPWDDSEEPSRPTDTLSRRFLLRAATSGFALAASGLLLPARFVADAEAGNDANGGAVGAERGKNHKDRRRRRRKHDSRNAPGKGPFRNVQFNVYNHQGSPQVVQVWVLSEDTFNNSIYSVKWSDTLSPGETREYKSEELYLLVTRPDYISSLGGPIFAQGFNTPIPGIDPVLSFGGTPKGFSGYRDGLHENTINFMDEGTNVKSFGFNATRLKDTAYIRFQIELV